MDAIILFIGIIVGFVISKLLSGRKEKEQGIVKSIILKTKKYKIHLHHWLISLIILLILIAFNLYNDFIYGFLMGLTIQGLTHKGFYHLICKK